MNDNFMYGPKLNIQVDSMRHSITTILDNRHEELLEYINAGIDSVLLELPAKVAREAREISQDVMEKALTAALEEYWNHGVGRSMLDEMIAKKFKVVTTR